MRAVLAAQHGAIPSTSWRWLLIAEPYSQTPLETLGNAGVGVALIGIGALAVRVAWAARLLRPLAAVGAMALSVYVAHALVLAWGLDASPASWTALGWFSATALLGAWCRQHLWRGSALRVGPLEWGLRSLNRWAAPRDSDGRYDSARPSAATACSHKDHWRGAASHPAPHPTRRGHRCPTPIRRHPRVGTAPQPAAPRPLGDVTSPQQCRARGLGPGTVPRRTRYVR